MSAHSFIITKGGIIVLETAVSTSSAMSASNGCIDETVCTWTYGNDAHMGKIKVCRGVAEHFGY